jgi:cytochrome c oxidase cbb3-type subunit III
MSDFTGSFWSVFVAFVSIVSIIACGVLLWTQSTKRLPKDQQADLHGHVWDDDLQEYNNPLPRWWMWMFYLTIAFAIAYLIYYPGLGSFPGTSAWSSTGEHNAEVAQAEAQYGPLFNQYLKTDIVELAKDPKATAVGQRLFLNYCSQCHGSDAGGGAGFPNLRDKDWLYGGDPDTIKATIMNGRNGVMPALGDALGGPQAVKEMANYVRSLSGLKHDAKMAQAAAPKFVICGACHGADGKGGRTVGAPNLTDKIWLYGSSEESIIGTITTGRGVNQLSPGQSAMPAHKDTLGEAKVHVLAAYVYSLGGGEPRPIAAALPAATPKAARRK